MIVRDALCCSTIRTARASSSGYLQPGSGTLPCTRVPRAGAESTASVPPTAAMRSRMFVEPRADLRFCRVKSRA